MDQRLHATGRPAPAPDSSAATGPYVVNLCASVAPLELKSASLPGLEKYRVYQVRRVEDDRPRYRLRLGFFTDEAAVEIVLSAVRQFYPGAFCVAAGSDDLKHAPGFDVRALGGAPVRRAGADAAATGRFEHLPEAAKPIAPARTQTAAPAADPKPKPTLELLPSAPPSIPESPAPRSGDTPFRVRPADPAAFASPQAELALQTELPADIRKLTSGLPPVVQHGPVLIDSTQTLRMLTESELADSNAPPWFAVQLAISDQPINLDTMPKLDIFSAFRLYSVAVPQQGIIHHSLRLGFFRESVSAEAVAGYLKTFFSAPGVLRVSAAEQSRFAERPQPPVLADRAVRSAEIIPLREGRNPAPAKAPVLSSPVAPPRTAASGAATPAAAKTELRKPIPPGKGKPPQKAPAAPAARALARKSSPPLGRAKPPLSPNRSLNDLLRDEARQVELSESGIRQIEAKGSLLSRLVGKLTR